jgi:hypothetical protein
MERQIVEVGCEQALVFGGGEPRVVEAAKMVKGELVGAA